MVKGINRRVTVDIINRIRGEGKINVFTKSLQKMGNIFNKVSNSIASSANKQGVAMERIYDKNGELMRISMRLGLTLKETKMAMDRLGYSISRTGQVMDSVGTSVRNFERDVGRTAAQMRPFRMELLSVMFAGMAMQRAVTGLMRKSTEWTGVWEILSTALGLLFLPIALDLLDWALAFLDWVETLDPETKKLFGIFAVGAGILGTLAMVFGQVGLALMGLGQLFPGIVSNIKATGGVLKGLSLSFKSLPKIIMGFGKSILGVFAGLSAPILIIIAIITAAIIGIFLAWKENFWNIREVVGVFVEGIKNLFGGLIDILMGIWDIFMGFITGDSQRVLEGIKRIFSGFFTKIIPGLFKVIVGAIGALFIGLVKIVWNIVKVLLSPFMWLADKLVGHSIIPDMVNAIIDWFLWLPKKIIQGFKNLANLIKNALMDIIPDWMIDIFKKGISIGSSVFGAAKGLLGSFQTGGIVPQTGPYMLHKGETVVPTGQGTTNNLGTTNNIVVNANVSRDYDVRRLADKLNRYLVQDYNRLSNRK